ncbi:hypothetical protein MFMK1_000691 [Metallumcola ferriviriculae]|uniref:Glycosyltransferase RgtA/B/C/D-like domain-containing protein n=1 Tax=Metallumcola ferriviriculae TaxID=3039180 RepID=A0AAU0UL44_9FIRM|nr:hypothetical protein MFMK1_000691 [Desulfitibacteraceae bacterium MK1]
MIERRNIVQNNKIRSSNGKVKFILASLALSVIVIYFFRGFLTYGMEFDEVFRANNLLPFINENAHEWNQSIFTLPLFKLQIPLMYKQYISSTPLLKYLPLIFFDNFLIGIRFLYLIYFLISITVLFYLASKYNFNLALILSLMIITSPILYPEITFGFVSTLHLLFFSIAAFLMYIYFNRDRKALYLWCAVFLSSFMVNLEFYSLWILSSLVLTSLLFFYQEFKSLMSVKNGITITSAVFVGLFNYIIYNVLTGFASFRPLFLKLFMPDKYNANPIDYKKTLPLQKEVALKMEHVSNFMGSSFDVYLVLFGLIVILYLIVLYKLVLSKSVKQYKIYFFPITNFLIIFFFILISPNTTRPGHYAYLLPFFELSLLSCLVLFYKVYKNSSGRLVKILCLFLPLVLISSNFFASNKIVTKASEVNGLGYFSPAIFQLNKYIVSNNIDFNRVVHLEWGLYSQLYFLNKGEADIHSVVFQLKNARNEGEREEVLKKELTSPWFLDVKELYFPLYSDLDKEVAKTFFPLMESLDGEIQKVKEFYETNGKEVFALYKLANYSDVRKRLLSTFQNVKISPSLKILKFGANVKNINPSKDFAMWFITLGHTRNTSVILNNFQLETVYYADHLTATVPKELLSKGITYELYLYDSAKGVKSNPVVFDLQ